LATRIIVLTNDLHLGTIFSECLERHPLCEELVFSNKAAQISQAVNPRGKNVILLDTGTQRITDSYLAALTEKYNLFVVLIGTTNLSNYMKFGFTDVLNKPIKGNDFSATYSKEALLQN
jgi:hypothetical protein